VTFRRAGRTGHFRIVFEIRLQNLNPLTVFERDCSDWQCQRNNTIFVELIVPQVDQLKALQVFETFGNRCQGTAPTNNLTRVKKSDTFKSTLVTLSYLTINTSKSFKHSSFVEIDASL
jgi:hypothetical protein